MEFRALKKAFQRHAITFVSSKWGIFTVLVAAVLTLNTCLHVVDTLLGTAIVCPRPFCNTNFADNIAGLSSESFLCSEPIDIVYTWVNGSDPKMLADLARIKGIFAEADKKTQERNRLLFNHTDEDPSVGEEHAGKSRFEDHDELKYSLRSVIAYAPWVRHIYLVTNGQIPRWLNLNHPKITVVPHSDIFVNKSHLPVFSSPAIETHLHRINGLSRRFLYLNDDTFFAAPIHPEDYISRKGFKIYFSWGVPNCADGCPSNWLKDGFCDKLCNTSMCDYDGGDCIGPNVKLHGGAHSSPGGAGGTPGTDHEPHHNPQEMCSPGCPDVWLGDRFCDPTCNKVECAYDATDCGVDKLHEVAYINASILETSFRVVLDKSRSVFVVNLSRIYPGASKILDGTHDSPSYVRFSTISQTHKLLVVFPSASFPKTTATFYLQGEHESKHMIYYIFNVTIKYTDIQASQSPHEIQPSIIPSASPTPSMRSAPYGLFIPSRKPLSIQIPDDVNAEFISEERRRARFQNKKKMLEKILDDEQREGTWKSYFSRFSPTGESPRKQTQALFSTRRKLLDMFGDSLKFVNAKLTRRFGSAARKVPAHMPHLIDRDVMNEVIKEWPEEWDQTSASRFRSPTNMQYAFTHFYWIIHAKKDFDAEEYFRDVLDINKNGLLDESEIRRVALILWEKKVAIEKLKFSFVPVSASVPNNETNATTSNLSHVMDSPAFSAPDEDDYEAKFDESRTKTHPLRAHGPTRNLLQALGEDDEDSREDESENEEKTEIQDFDDDVYDFTKVRQKRKSMYARNRTCKGGNLKNHSRRSNSTKCTLDPLNSAASSSDNQWAYNKPWTYTPPVEEVRIMNQEYLTAVLDLVELAVMGLGVNRTIRPSWTGLMTAYHFKGSHLADILFANLEKEFRYKHELVDLDDVTFFMIRDNLTVVQNQMDHVLYKRPKFLCINDNMNHTHPDHPRIVDVVQKLLRMYYPTPSPFELPDGTENEFLHLEDMNNIVLARKHKWRLYAVGIVFGGGIGVLMCFVVCQFIVEKWKHLRRRKEVTIPRGQGPGSLLYV